VEEEIDLRPYFETLLLNWKWYVGTAFLAAVIALGVSFIVPPTYEATALVAVTQPGQIVQFDPRFEAVEDPRPLEAYPELATSDQLLENLLAEIIPPVQNVESLEDLRQVVESESGRDPSLVRLIVRYRNPSETARMVNVWAELFVTRANEIYGDLGGGQVAFFESQLEEAKAELEAAEQGLIEFQARDRTTIIDNELSSLRREQADNLARQREIAFLVQDIQSLREQLQGATGGDPVSFADQLTALFLQIKAFGAQSGVPLQLQIDIGQSLTVADHEAQIVLLDGLQQTLVTRSSRIDERLTQLEPQILALQGQRQELRVESSRLE
jgi:capsular polysaccharide biosynthesis protein